MSSFTRHKNVQEVINFEIDLYITKNDLSYFQHAAHSKIG